MTNPGDSKVPTDERAATRAMATEHRIHNEKWKKPVPGQAYTLDMVRLVCSCGWTSHWTNGQETVRVRHAHLKDAAVND